MRFASSLVAFIASAAAVVAAPLDKRQNNWSGPATYFYQNGNAGACGWVSQDSDWVVAMWSPIYGNGWACGQQISVQNDATGEVLTATVADECPTCDPNGLDMSTGLFNALFGGLGQGMGGVTYWMNN